ncbi:MAG: hypothetical protein HON81_06110 [Verrucomicrobia bacterium]|nr:hypothetical protein [Verrucomicrobiota bacterium]
MTVGPTVAGGLKLVPETDHDWMLLIGIAGDSDSDLAGRLAGLMDEDTMWDEIVAPELAEEFSKQRIQVVKEVMRAKEEDGDIHILKGSVDVWYGALNQARLALEDKYKFGAREEVDPKIFEDPSVRAAYFRNNFYSHVQGLLLQYVMVD